MDKRALIAIVLVGIIWAGYAAFTYPGRNKGKNGAEGSPTGTELAAASPSNTGEEATTTAGAGTATSTPVDGQAEAPENDEPPVEATPESTPAPVQVTKFENEDLVITFTNQGARPVEATLKRYPVEVNDDEPVRLFGEVDSDPELQPMVPRFEVLSTEGGLTRFRSLLPVDAVFEVVRETDHSVTYAFENESLRVEREWSLTDETYELALTERYINVSGRELNGRPVMSWFTKLKEEQKGRRRGRMSDQFNPTALSAGRVQRKSVKEVGAPREVVQDADLIWFGIDDRYFMTALIPIDPPAVPVGTATGDTVNSPKVSFVKPSEKIIGLRAARAQVVLQPEDSTEYTYNMFVGPKDYDVLKSVGHDLDKSLNLGRFIGPIANMLLVVLRWFESWTHHWGLAIVLMTLLIKGLLLPLTHKSMKMMRENSLKMQKVQPEIDRLKKRYPEPEDKEKLNQEMMALFQRKGVNPLSTLGGCIPMVLQMPIWFALYRVLYADIDLRHAPLFLWVHDLSAPDPYKVLPILLGVVMFAQQRLMPQPTAGTQNQTQMQMMKWVMPIMFTFIMLNLPSGLVLYIFVNTCLSIVQSLYINKTMPSAAAAAPAKT